MADQHIRASVTQISLRLVMSIQSCCISDSYSWSQRSGDGCICKTHQVSSCLNTSTVIPRDTPLAFAKKCVSRFLRMWLELTHSAPHTHTHTHTVHRCILLNRMKDWNHSDVVSFGINCLFTALQSIFNLCHVLLCFLFLYTITWLCCYFQS